MIIQRHHSVAPWTMKIFQYNSHNFTICVYGTTCEKLILYYYINLIAIHLGEDCLEISRKSNAPI